MHRNSWSTYKKCYAIAIWNHIYKRKLYCINIHPYIRRHFIQIHTENIQTLYLNWLIDWLFCFVLVCFVLFCCGSMFTLPFKFTYREESFFISRTLIRFSRMMIVCIQQYLYTSYSIPQQRSTLYVIKTTIYHIERLHCVLFVDRI